MGSLLATGRGKALAAAGVLGTAALALLLLRAPFDPGDLIGGPEASPSPTVSHAAWSFRVVPGGVRGPSGRQRRAAERRAERVSEVVATVNDALVLGEGEVADLEGSAVTPDVARALGRSALTLGDDVVEAVAARRRARIGIDVRGAKRAVATSVIVARVSTAERQVRVRYETTLWLERARRGWRVFAFDGSRRRA